MSLSFRRIAAAPVTAALMLAAFLLSALPAAAQELSSGLVGFSAGSNDPILIESETLVVQDGGKVATFSGNVVVQQNETTLTTHELKVYYEGDAVNGGGQQRIKRIEAEGAVFVTNRDQTASGDRATFDMATEIVTMLGNVELTQDGSAVRGDKLVVNLKTKESRVETNAKKPGRVQGLFMPGSSKDKPKTEKN
ncbi:MAG: LptA/OstA family protein [Hyphomicrobiales bacterium]